MYLIGDTNARLGSVLNDRNIHGHLTSNQNKPLLLEFLEYSGLVILNKLYCIGIPTYQIVYQKRSIIDLCLTNSPESVRNFEIEPKSFGVSSQTCHKALTTTILLKLSDRTPIAAPRRTSYGKLTAKKRQKITLEVANKTSKLNQTGSYSYSHLIEMFRLAKLRILGKRTERHKSPHLSVAMRELQKRYGIALEAMKKEKTAFSFFVADNLEKLLNYQYNLENDRKFSTWIRKMNNLDYQNRTRGFYSEIRRMQRPKEEPVPIYN